MTENQELTLHTGGPLTQYLPQDGKGLMYLAEQVARAGMFKSGFESLTKEQAFVMMVKGAELGLSPMQSLEHISIIKGRPFVGAAVITARVRMSPNLESWDVESDKTHCTIKWKRKGQAANELTVKIEDIPKRYFEPSKKGEPSNWTLIPEDMLFAWTVRRVARRHFPDALLDLGDAVQDEPRNVIDVAVVERKVGEESVTACERCGANSYLHANNRGGMFAVCSVCGHAQPPPQAVRDAIRGRAGDFRNKDDEGDIKGEVIDMPAELPEPSLEPGLEDGRDATPEEEEATYVLMQPRGDIEKAILGELAAKMEGDKPFHLHEIALKNFGWDGKVRVSEWLKTLDDENVMNLRDELCVVEVT